MKINKLKINNYKMFRNVTVEMNDNMNIFVGENDSGKTTILEALTMVLTGKINGSSSHDVYLHRPRYVLR